MCRYNLYRVQLEIETKITFEHNTYQPTCDKLHELDNWIKIKNTYL